jgi:uncharacterized protein (DUF983 family)
MKARKSSLYAVFNFKCPRCHEGKFFLSHPYDLSKAGDLHEHCSVCGLKYDKEPGFYYGAMYVAYALAVALFVTIWTSYNLWLPNVSVWWQIGTVILATVILGPYIYALSKTIWAKFFIKYDPNAIADFKRNHHS